MRQCHSCLLNTGDTCWGFASPRDQWRGHRRCRAFENETAYEMFRQWSSDVTVKTRKQIRQEFHRKKKTSFDNPHFLDRVKRRSAEVSRFSAGGG